MKKVTFVAAAAAVVALAGQARAQVFTLPFQAPRSTGGDVGIYLSDGPGDLAVEGILRRSLGTSDVGLRLGFADVGNGDVLLGVDWRTPLHFQTAPIDVALTLGAQGAFGDVDGVGGQVGLSLGHTFASPGVGITPYVHPRLAVVAPLVDNADSEVDVLADVGVNFDFAPNLSLRFGANLGNGADFGLGLAWRR